MAALQNGEQFGNILHSQAHIWNHIFNFINSMSLKCAIQLEIPDIIHRHGVPMMLSELVEALQVKKEKSYFIYRLMDILIHSGFFVKKNIPKMEGVDDEEGKGYMLTPTSRLLLKDEPCSVRPFLLAMLDPIIMDPWHHLSKWFNNDDVHPFETTYGRTLWDYAEAEPKLNHFFNDAMASDSTLVMSVVIENFGGIFEGLHSIVDVGGGIGTVSKAIAKAFPNINCINFDLPHVVGDMRASNNLSYVSGDMFEAIPAADAVLLKWILHDWADEECVKILKQCKEVIPSKERGGKVIIIEMILNNKEEDHQARETQLFFDMLMMVLQTGRERSEKDWAKLFTDAGFNDYKITPILGLRSLIEVYP